MNVQSVEMVARYSQAVDKLVWSLVGETATGGLTLAGGYAASVADAFQRASTALAEQGVQVVAAWVVE